MNRQSLSSSVFSVLGPVDDLLSIHRSEQTAILLVPCLALGMVGGTLRGTVGCSMLVIQHLGVGAIDAILIVAPKIL